MEHQKPAHRCCGEHATWPEQATDEQAGCIQAAACRVCGSRKRHAESMVRRCTALLLEDTTAARSRGCGMNCFRASRSRVGGCHQNSTAARSRSQTARRAWGVARQGTARALRGLGFMGA
eukprot:6027202-Alexandrium_andersonii.AAC.1